MKQFNNVKKINTNRIFILQMIIIILQKNFKFALCFIYKVIILMQCITSIDFKT